LCYHPVTCFMSGDTGLAGFCQNLAVFFLFRCFLVRADTDTDRAGFFFSDSCWFLSGIFW
jgi:hypothetical protein